jgi:hypothetical protein
MSPQPYHMGVCAFTTIDLVPGIIYNLSKPPKRHNHHSWLDTGIFPVAAFIAAVLSFI